MKQKQVYFMKALSAVIITFNEERNIGRCIDSVKAVADEIIVLDSFSDDDTVGIARSKGATVRQSVFSGYINQKNKVLAMAANENVLLLDADEALSDELRSSVMAVKMEGFPFQAYKVKRCNVFCGKHIKRGLWYPDKKLRLFDKRIAVCGGYNPHDKIMMQEDVPVKLLKGDLVHYTFDSMAEYLERNEEVSTIAARSLYEAGARGSRLKVIFSPLWSFFNGYFLRMGFMEGYTGLVIAFHTAKQGYLKHLKLRRLHRSDTKEVQIDITPALTNKLLEQHKTY
jgi:glycosyltransferase involved in cell wall biosynthesis